MPITTYSLILIASYLYGNILFAVPITRLFIGKDIRQIGNTNPGASNVQKNVGTFPAILVLILDASKAIIPMLFTQIFVFHGQVPDNRWFYMTLIGLVAILGHTRPFWNGFKKGGGGMSTTIGICLYILPVEYLAAFGIGTVITYTFMKNAEYKLGRWVSLYAIILAPIFAWLSNLWFNLPLFAHVSMGGHPLQILLSPLLIMTLLFALNSVELFYWIRRPDSTVNPR